MQKTDVISGMKGNCVSVLSAQIIKGTHIFKYTLKTIKTINPTGVKNQSKQALERGSTV